MNPADKFLIFFGLLDLFYDYPLDFGSIIHPQFFFLYMGYFDSVIYVHTVVNFAPKFRDLGWFSAIQLFMRFE